MFSSINYISQNSSCNFCFLKDESKPVITQVAISVLSTSIICSAVFCAILFTTQLLVPAVATTTILAVILLGSDLIIQVYLHKKPTSNTDSSIGDFDPDMTHVDYSNVKKEAYSFEVSLGELKLKELTTSMINLTGTTSETPENLRFDCLSNLMSSGKPFNYCIEDVPGSTHKKMTIKINDSADENIIVYVRKSKTPNYFRILLKFQYQDRTLIVPSTMIFTLAQICMMKGHQYNLESGQRLALHNSLLEVATSGIVFFEDTTIKDRFYVYGENGEIHAFGPDTAQSMSEVISR